MRKEGTHFYLVLEKKEVDVRGQIALVEKWHCFLEGLLA